jgi:vacuolar-type H+-ATPase subunit I/STV1
MKHRIKQIYDGTIYDSTEGMLSQHETRKFLKIYLNMRDKRIEELLKKIEKVEEENCDYTNIIHKELLTKIEKLETENKKYKKQLEEVETMVLYLSEQVEKLKPVESIKTESVEIPNFIHF